MTSQKDQIQALITDIDGVLQKATPRLPWVVSGEMTQQRQVLERVRNYLVAVQRRQIASEGFGQAGARPDLLAHDIYYQPAPPADPASQAAQPGQQAYGQDDLNAQQMLQAIVQEMSYLRSNLMQPLQADVEGLRQQRETLAHEIRQLEAQRQGYAGQLPGQQQLIAEFLQALMSRLQETLPQQIAQTLSRNQQALSSAHPYLNNLALAGSAPSVIATSDAPSQGLGNIQVSQAPADELVIRLDSTLSVVFESLQRNVQSYQESLSQGLDKMHSMGQQGEMMFTALISHLAEQLGRETSAYLQPAATTEPVSVRSPSSITPPANTPLPTAPPIPSVNPLLFSQPNADAVSSPPLALPFPGTEISDYAATSTTVPSVDTAIESWLRASGASAPPDVDLELADLNLDSFDLSQLADQDVKALLELDATLLGTNLPAQPILSPTAPIAAPPTTSAAITVEDTADIDAALKLLEQLSSELQEQPTSVADADAQIDRVLSSPTALAGGSSTSGIPDDARDELDEFYESLFGNDAIGAPTQDTPPSDAIGATATTPQPVATPVIESVIEPEPAVAPSETQPAVTPIGVQADIQPSDVRPSDAPPIYTLPAETQMPTGALAEPIALAAPIASTVADPTLGWHLPAAPLGTTPAATEQATTEPAAEPEIPAALLDDELLGGWDFDDAEIDVTEPATISTTTPTTDLLGGWDSPVDDQSSLPPAEAAIDGAEPAPTPAATSTTNDLLGGWDLAPADDRASLPLDAPPTTDAPSTTDPLAAFFDESQPSATDTDTNAGTEPTFAFDAAPADHQNETSPSERRDEISALTDLFGETAPETGSLTDLFGETALGEAVTAEAPPLVNPPADPTGWSFQDLTPSAAPTPTPTPNLADGYLTDDRYTPASPDEDLLLLDESIEAIDSELWLDEGTLSRLSEDLFNLEEAIGEPVAPSYSLEPPSADAQALFGDTVAFADTTAFADPIAPSEPAPTASETTALGDWSDASLDDFAFSEVAPAVAPDAVAATPPTTQPALFPLESESGAIAADPPGAFLLEGMDDLFANTPIEPPVTPIEPPVLPTAIEPPASFTLEGMDDLFADSLAGDQAVPTASTPAVVPPLTLEGMDDLFTDAFIVNPASSPTSATPAATFTLDGVDDLFTDTPVVNPPSVPTSATPAASFTLEGVNDLFTDAPVGESVSVPSQPPAADQPQPFTLEGVNELFADLPPVLTTPPMNTLAPAVPEATFATALTPSEPVADFTLEQVGNLFVELPAAEASAHDGSAGTIVPVPDALPGDPASAAPFTFEQVGDLFVEVPSEASTLSERSPIPTAPLEPLSAPASSSLEQVGDLFVETPSAEAFLADLLDGSLPSSQSLATSEPSTLEQAFASLMGSFDDPVETFPSGTDTTEATTQAPEKKKGAELAADPGQATVLVATTALTDDRPLATTVEPAIAPPPIDTDALAADGVWCLGIDIGTTALSAVLAHEQTGTTYPLVWQETETPGERLASLPAIAYLSAQQLQHPPEVPLALWHQALALESSATRQAAAPGLLLSHFKPSLDTGTPYVSEQQSWEPVLQWADQPLALGWLQQALVALLETLQGQAFGLTVTAPTLSVTTLRAAIANLSRVVIGCPTGWSDTYRFNLREAVLSAGLVDRAEQIYCVEEAIAALLATLPQPTASKQPFDGFSGSLGKAEASLGGTLVVSAGATTTELLLVDVPRNPMLLTREALSLHSLAYAGDAIDQDIICQILYPSAWDWDSLELQNLVLPLPGEPDQEARDRLQQRLRRSELGCHLLTAARQLKRALQHQDTATFKLHHQQWTVSQQDLHNRVTMPYLQQLNRSLNGLLNQSGIPVQAVRQVICSGGTTALPAIAHWLKQKLPNIRLLDATNSNGTASQIAHGLAILPHYPQVLDAVRHQYSDYFLLHELVRLLPNEPLSVGGIFQLLEQQGIHTHCCQRSILNLLEGQLPAGLLPSRDETSLFTPSSWQNPTDQTLTTTPLFDKEGTQIYRFNLEQRDRLQRYLNAILANTHQALTEPLSIDLGTAVNANG